MCVCNIRASIYRCIYMVTSLFAAIMTLSIGFFDMTKTDVCVYIYVHLNIDAYMYLFIMHLFVSANWVLFDMTKTDKVMGVCMKGGGEKGGVHFEFSNHVFIPWSLLPL